MEDQIYNEYIKPKQISSEKEAKDPVASRDWDNPEVKTLKVPKKKQPLFQKTTTYETIDGSITCEQPSLEPSYSSYKHTTLRNKI